MSRKAMPPPIPTAQRRIWFTVSLPVTLRQPRAVLIWVLLQSHQISADGPTREAWQPETVLLQTAELVTDEQTEGTGLYPVEESQFWAPTVQEVPSHLQVNC